MEITEQMANDWTTCRWRLRVVTAFTFFSAWICLGFWSSAVAQEPRKAGKEGRILVTLEWGEVPLRQRLTEFGKKYEVPIFLDRRVDPDQRIDLSAQDLPVEGVLSLAAQKLKLGTCTVGKVHYLGPKSTASRLTGVIAQRKLDLRKLPPQVRTAWSKSKELKWDEAASPRDIAAALAQEAGAELEDSPQIPHDVWPAYDLPAMTLTERLSLVLAGFDLTFRVSEDGSQIRVMQLPRADVAAGGKERDSDDAPQPGTTKTITKGPIKKVFSMTVQKQPAGAVLNTVAKQLGKEFKYDPSLREKLREDVSFAVKDVTLEELLAKTLTPLGLSCKVTEKTLEVIELP